MVLPDGTLFGEGVKTRLKEHLLEESEAATATLRDRLKAILEEALLK